MTYQDAINEIIKMQEELKVLQQRYEKSTQTYEKRKKQLEQYKTLLMDEQVDVEQLENLSLSKLLYKMIGKYEEKYQKEYQEYLLAKKKYDEYEIDIEQLANEVERYRREMLLTKEKLQQGQVTLRTDYKEGQLLAERENEERKRLYREKKELEEAIQATTKVLTLANSVKEEYSSAKSWATYDTFCNGGIFADMMKYSKVDKAAEITNQLKSASTMMKKELVDVKLVFEVELDNMSDGTRFWDFAFDNIFTDMNVRNRLAENIDHLTSYIDKVERIQSDLQNQIKQVNERLNSLPMF